MACPQRKATTTHPPLLAQFTGKGLTSPDTAGARTRLLAVSLREVAPPDDWREGPYLHDLFGIDPPFHQDLHTKRIIGFHHDSNRSRGRNLHVVARIVAEQYDLMVRNAKVDATIRSLTASPQLTQPLVRYDKILQHRHGKYGAEHPARPYARASNGRDIFFRCKSGTANQLRLKQNSICGTIIWVGFQFPPMILPVARETEFKTWHYQPVGGT